jgi:DNA polymerase III epsilon subunit-like protein
MNITIKDKEYIVKNNMVYNINNNSLYGYYNISDNTVITLKSLTKIINHIENINDFLRISFVGKGIMLLQEHFKNNYKITFNNYTFNVIIFYKSFLENYVKLEYLEILGECIIYDKNENMDAIINLLKQKNINYELVSSNNMIFINFIKQIPQNIKYMVLDTETTGIFEKNAFPDELDKFNKARLIELGYIVDSKECSYLVKPDNFVIENHNIHGITTEMANEGLDIVQVMDKFHNDLLEVDMIVCHNISFDMNILLSECFRYNNMKLLNCINSKYKLCTMKLGKNKLNLPKNPKLVDLYFSLFDKTVEQEHRSLSDCRICKACFDKLYLL